MSINDSVPALQTQRLGSQQTLDFALARTFRLTEMTSFQFRGEAFNKLKQSQSGHTQPLREHSAVRYDYHGHDARAGNSVERKTVFLSVLRGWSQYCFPVGAGLAAVIWLRTSHKSL
jgi:hypothetical protein